MSLMAVNFELYIYLWKDFYFTQIMCKQNHFHEHLILRIQGSLPCYSLYFCRVLLAWKLQFIFLKKGKKLPLIRSIANKNEHYSNLLVILITWRLNTCYSMLGISMNFQKARQPFVVQNGVLAESSRIFALAIGSLALLVQTFTVKPILKSQCWILVLHRCLLKFVLFEIVLVRE